MRARSASARRSPGFFDPNPPGNIARSAASSSSAGASTSGSGLPGGRPGGERTRARFDEGWRRRRRKHGRFVTPPPARRDAACRGAPASHRRSRHFAHPSAPQPCASRADAPSPRRPSPPWRASARGRSASSWQNWQRREARAGFRSSGLAGPGVTRRATPMPVWSASYVASRAAARAASFVASAASTARRSRERRRTPCVLAPRRRHDAVPRTTSSLRHRARRRVRVVPVHPRGRADGVWEASTIGAPRR